MSFPSREERIICWGARDKYWECLDKNSIKDNTPTTGPCEEFRKIFEKSCSSQWVKHFDRKRSYLQFKEKIEKDGYDPLDDEKIPNKVQSTERLFAKRRVYHDIVCR